MEPGPGSLHTGSSMDEQHALLQLLLKENEHIQRENELLTTFAEKAEAVAAQLEAAAAPDERSRKRRAAAAARKRAEEPLRPLTDEEKGDVVGTALEGLDAEIAALRSAGDKDVDDIRTLMEEVDMRIAETKRATYEFKRDIIMGGEDALSGGVSADKITRFWEDQIRDKEVLLEKVILKNSTYKAAITKLEAQLAHKEEMGEVLHLVDFEQLKIENQQHMEAIDVKNKELLQLKTCTGKSVQALNVVKERLARLEAEGASLRRALGDLERDAGAAERGIATTRAQAASTGRLCRQLAGSSQGGERPLTLEYMRLKAEVDELQHQVQEWRRKADVARGSGAATVASAR